MGSRSSWPLFAAVTALLVAACGKTGGASNVAGTYHLASGDPGDLATSLVLREDGTFTVQRESCTSVGDVDCGRWRADIGTAAHVVPRDGLYWPTPGAFPGTVFTRLTLQSAPDDTLRVAGESPWAGTFTQVWARGRSCQVCRGHDGPHARGCDDPLPACTPP